MPYNLKGCWTTARIHSAELLAGSKPSSPQSRATPYGHTALPRAEARPTRELRRTATGPWAQTTASETVSMRGIKEANIISKYQKCTGRSDKKGTRVTRSPCGGRIQWAPGEPGSGKQGLRPIRRPFHAAARGMLYIKAFFLPLKTWGMLFWKELQWHIQKRF